MNGLQTAYRPAQITPTDDQLARVVDEYQLQTGVAGAQHAKSTYCMRLVIDLRKHAYLTAREAMDWLVILDSTVEYPAPYDEMWRQFRDELFSDLFNDVLVANRLAAKNILREVDRELYIPPVPPKRPGLMARLLAAITGRSAT